MDSDPTTINQLFKPERQYFVPLYQRGYVWKLENQWVRLWSDIQEKAEARLAELKPTPHFLGAVVLDPQERKKLRGVENVHIIDGQQRLTTLQFVLAALSIVLRKKNNLELLPVIEKCLINSDETTMRDKDVERYKIWPTLFDREAYLKGISAKSLDDLRRDFPDNFTQRGTLKKIGKLHPPTLAAIWFFVEQILSWVPKNDRDEKEVLESLAEAILEDFVVISIVLGQNDDAQIIFETLNGHGVELTATDLIRNYIFMTAESESSDTVSLYSSLWVRYENASWKAQERRGRLNRPRMEWFVQSVLQSEMRDEVDQGRIYAEYRRYANNSGLNAKEQLALLDKYADSYQALLENDVSEPIGRFGKRFSAWDASTTYVIALAISKSDCLDVEQDEMFALLGSYLVRRAICGLTNKNYNKVFLQVLKNLKNERLTPATFRNALEGLSGDASRWPRDDIFKHNFLSAPIYPGNMDTPKLRSLLIELENALRTERTEEPFAPSLSNLDIDHMMPQSWFEHWPLADGSYSNADEVNAIRYAPPNLTLSPRQTLIINRVSTLCTIGNLTLLHYGTNRAAQNYSFNVKQELFLKHSNLHLNRVMLTAITWDERSIRDRSETLYLAASRIWPGPH